VSPHTIQNENFIWPYASYASYDQNGLVLKIHGVKFEKKISFLFNETLCIFEEHEW